MLLNSFMDKIVPLDSWLKTLEVEVYIVKMSCLIEEVVLMMTMKTISSPLWKEVSRYVYITKNV